MQDIIKQILKDDPFLSQMGGVDLVESGDGFVKIQTEFSRSISRSGGIMHGGAIMSLLDTAGGLSIVTRGNLVNQVTVNLNTDFMRPISSGPVTATGKITREGQRLVFCEMELHDGEGKLCARGTGSWFVFR